MVPADGVEDEAPRKRTRKETGAGPSESRRTRAGAASQTKQRLKPKPAYRRRQ
ncbi:hypothetical protein K438DRAFT_1881090 [Mycena galopus ATCC 62051]|nr:hypothetical protein K438DRAFT_1881090 [Mycena galopus ATCC 62051]